MPQEWQKILDDNGITKAEQEQNPDEVSVDRLPRAFPGRSTSRVADDQILAVVRFFQDREAKGTENGEDEVWEKMGHAGPAHPPQTPTPPTDMSREHSREALPQMTNFAHPVSLAEQTLSRIVGLTFSEMRLRRLPKLLRTGIWR